MMKPQVSPVYAVYLLHFDEPVSGKQHYLGICKAARLHWRMLEHARGSGASLTKRVFTAGTGFTVGATWATDNPDLERKLKKQSHFQRYCAICQGDGQQMAFHLPGLHYEAKKEASSFQSTGWPHQ